MQRILVIGSPGAGKSTFAIELAKLINLPVIHLDKEFWQPGWVGTPRDKWRERIESFVAGERWIIDGTYDSTLEIRLPRATKVIFLDFPRFFCMWRIFKRVIINYGKVRFDMGDRCPERFDFSFVKWTWNYRKDHYPKIFKKLKKYYCNGDLVILKSPEQIRQYLNSIGVVDEKGTD